ncbi:MAG: glycosyltransferase family 39 protein [Candidatus Aenigmatarchaeota archaeon]
MCVGSVKKFFKRLRERDALAWFVVLIIAVHLAFLVFSPVFRYGDDMRYFATAKTIALTGDLAPKYEMFGGTPFYGPPLIEYVLTFLYFVSFGNNYLWFFLGKIFEMAMFFGSLLLVYKFAGKFNLSKSEKIVALGFFSFLPISIYTSVSVMQDMVLTFFTLLLFWLLSKEKQNYALIGIVSGVVMLSKFTGVLSIFATLLAMLLMKNDKKTKAILIVSIILGSALISGFWYYRNFLVFGNPIYHVGYSSYATPIVSESLQNKIVNGYLSFWGIVPFSKISDKLVLDENLVALLGTASGLFFLPVVLLFFKGLQKKWKRVASLIPFIVVFSLFSFGYITLIAYAQERFFLPALGVFSIVVALACKDRKIFTYMFVCFAAFLLIAGITTEFMLKKEISYRNSLERINAELGTPVLQKDDFDLRIMENLFFNINANTSEKITCNAEKNGYVSFCKSEKFIFRDFFTSGTS